MREVLSHTSPLQHHIPTIENFYFDSISSQMKTFAVNVSGTPEKRSCIIQIKCKGISTEWKLREGSIDNIIGRALTTRGFFLIHINRGY